MASLRSVGWYLMDAFRLCIMIYTTAPFVLSKDCKKWQCFIVLSIVVNFEIAYFLDTFCNNKKFDMKITPVAPQEPCTFKIQDRWGFFFNVSSLKKPQEAGRLHPCPPKWPVDSGLHWVEDLAEKWSIIVRINMMYIFYANQILNNINCRL